MVAGKAGAVHERVIGGFRKDWTVSGKAAWFQGGVVWFPARLWGFTKVCVAYDVGSLMVQG